jgi:hypothetical protein
MQYETFDGVTSTPLTPYKAQSLTTYQPSPLEPIEGRRVVGYERYGGDLLVPVYEALPVTAQPVALRDLTPAPLIDPVAQRVLAGGIGAGATGAGVGWGVGQAFAGIAAFGGVTSLAVIAALLLVARLGGSRTQIHNETHVTNTNRWFGKSNTPSHQG